MIFEFLTNPDYLLLIWVLNSTLLNPNKRKIYLQQLEFFKSFDIR